MMPCGSFPQPSASIVRCAFSHRPLTARRPFNSPATCDGSVGASWLGARPAGTDAGSTAAASSSFAFRIRRSNSICRLSATFRSTDSPMPDWPPISRFPTLRPASLGNETLCSARRWRHCDRAATQRGERPTHAKADAARVCTPGPTSRAAVLMWKGCARLKDAQPDTRQRLVPARVYWCRRRTPRAAARHRLDCNPRGSRRAAHRRVRRLR